MSKIILILGGARSGKSTFALSLGRKSKKVAFIATCLALDKEMAFRIKMHQRIRPKSWQTFEEPRDVSSLLNKLSNDFDCIILDCLTLLVSNLVLSGYKDKEILRRIKDLLVNLKKIKAKVILVSNEVGLGIVPQNKLARQFRDVAGKINQQVASNADEVIFMVSGIPLILKKEMRR